MATEPRQVHEPHPDPTHGQQHGQHQQGQQHGQQSQGQQQHNQRAAQPTPAKAQEPGTGRASDKSAADIKADLVKAANERLKGRPTPTQEELDRMKLGEHVEVSPDGSDPDPFDQQAKHQHGASYRTRDMQAR